MKVDSNTLEWPELSSKTQLPPTASPRSKTVMLSNPRSDSVFTAARPLGPAPMTQIRWCNVTTVPSHPVWCQSATIT